MRVAVMQPYLFPYLGYFQLLHAVDAFVLLDDVAFIKKGWINRNRLLVNKASYLFTIPLASSSQNKLIKDLRLQPDSRARRKLLTTIAQAYKAAPEFERIFPLVAQVLLATELDLTALVLLSLTHIQEYLGLAVPIVRSSAILKNNELTGQRRIIELCHRLQAHEYVNLLGGAALYSSGEFARAGIALQFLQPVLAPYQQPVSVFVPGLSIIDGLMHNSVAQVRTLLAASCITKKHLSGID